MKKKLKIVSLLMDCEFVKHHCSTSWSYQLSIERYLLDLRYCQMYNDFGQTWKWQKLINELMLWCWQVKLHEEKPNIMSLLHLAFLRNLKRDRCHKICTNQWIPAIPDTLLSNMYQYELWFGQRDFFGLGSSFSLFSEGKLKWNLKAPPKKLC